MDTARLKRFATEARTKIKQGVTLMIRQWGFDAEGNVIDEPQLLQGGTLFRNQVIGDEDVYHRWCALRNKIQQVGLRNVYEEAAYTWFNRFIAIKILSKNELLESYLDYEATDGKPTPIIITQARRGMLPEMSEYNRRRVMDMAEDHNREAELLTLLITSVCHNTPILSNCFGQINDYTELLLPRTVTTQGDFLDMLNDDSYITEDDYRQPELIGWLYQFYISERKDEVFASFKSGKKATKDEIPAATQIFTPNWIVKYMVQNTIGRIYLDNNPYSGLKENWKYLVEPSDGCDTVENKYEVENPEEITIIDAGCGSGHILVEAFDTLYNIYLEQYASPREACDSILQYNIVGIDIDTRAKQLAQFALLMKACSYVPEMADCHQMPKVFDMPQPISEMEMRNLRDTLTHFFLGGTTTVIKETIEAIELLQNAQELGSIMKFNISDATRYAIKTAMENDNASQFSFYQHLRLLLAFTEKYASVCMNPPYMGSGNMNVGLSKYVKDNYPDSKADLFSVFMEVAIAMLAENGKYGMINMQSWMFLSSFENLRTKTLNNYHIDNMLHLGPRTFDELSGEVVQNAAFVISKHKSSTAGTYYRLVSGGNCHTKESMFLNPEEIETEFAEQRQIYFPNISQTNFSKIPGSPIVYWVTDNLISIFISNQSLFDVSRPRLGHNTANNDYFLRNWYEINFKKGSVNTTELYNGKEYKWVRYTKGVGFRKWYAPSETMINWENDGKELKDFKPATLRNFDYMYREAINFPRIGSGIFCARYTPEGTIFDVNAPACFNKEYLNYILAILNSKVSGLFLSFLCPTLSFQAGDVSKLPIIISVSQKDIIDDISKKSVLITKQDWNAHETSWDFQENELVRLVNKHRKETGAKEYPIEAVMMVYQSEWSDKFMQLHANEVELNRQFIEIYGLQDELTPDVPLDEVTILQQGEISIENGEIVWHDDVIVKQLISYAIGCWLGRYRLDRPGLHIAHPAPTEEELVTYKFDGQDIEIDDDGIIPILPDDSPFTDNARNRIVDFISTVFGAENQIENLNYLERALGKSLTDYLAKDFWKDHKKMYQNRPIYWLFSSKKGAFQCLAYMHRMDEYTLERIRQKYLLPYISFLDDKVSAMQARETLSTAETRQLTKLKTMLDECREYHDRLHQFSQKNISFDLDDGVVKNYALFGDVVAKLK